MESREGPDRRAVLGGLATLGAASMLSAAPPAAAAPAPAALAPAPAAPKLAMKFGCGLYDRMLALYTREVQPEGIELSYTPITNSRALFDKVERGEFDVAEMSSSEYLARKGANQCPFVALPVFANRRFRQGHVLVNRHAGIKTAKDLEGKRVGTELYTISSAIWTRGMLQHEYGVDLSKIHWIQGSVDAPGRWGDPEVMPLLKPVSIEINKSGKSLSQLISAGKLDALATSTLPANFGEDPDVVRLFPNYNQLEREYFKRTGIFPIIHLIVIKQDVYEKHPFIAASLYKAFNESKQKGLDQLKDGRGNPPYMMPFLDTYIEDQQAVFGKDPWPYGLEPNRKALQTLIGYMVDQAMIPKPIPVDDLFLKV